MSGAFGQETNACNFEVVVVMVQDICLIAIEIQILSFGGRHLPWIPIFGARALDISRDFAFPAPRLYIAAPPQTVHAQWRGTTFSHCSRRSRRVSFSDNSPSWSCLSSSSNICFWIRRNIHLKLRYTTRGSTQATFPFGKVKLRLTRAKGMYQRVAQSPQNG